jgi:ribosomal protein S18 acetylase RimI-like enzyme
VFFKQNKQSFFFIYNGKELIGNILILNNYIQSLAVAKKYQRQHYGEKLVKYATNYILSKGYKDIVLNVMNGNTKAEMLYQKLGFKKRS